MNDQLALDLFPERFRVVPSAFRQPAHGFVRHEVELLADEADAGIIQERRDIIEAHQEIIPAGHFSVSQSAGDKRQRKIEVQDCDCPGIA